MTAPVLRGSYNSYRQWQKYSFDPQRGFIYSAEYKGLGQANMAALQAAYVAAGIAHTLSEHQDVFTIEAEDATQAYTIDSWQIVGNEESRDGFSHPKLMTALAAVYGNWPDYIAALRAALENQMTVTEAFASGQSLNGTPAITQKFYQLAVCGQDTYRRGQYVLRHVTNAPNRWGVNISDVGIDQIYTTAQLLTEVQDSAQWIFPMPGRLAYKIGAIPVPTFQTNYLWGWLKQASTETSSSNNRIDITTEYILEQWPSGTYYEPF